MTNGRTADRQEKSYRSKRRQRRKCPICVVGRAGQGRIGNVLVLHRRIIKLQPAKPPGRRLELEVWSFSGCWRLVLGGSTGGRGSKDCGKMRPRELAGSFSPLVFRGNKAMLLPFVNMSGNRKSWDTFEA